MILYHVCADGGQTVPLWVVILAIVLILAPLPIAHFVTR